MKKIEIVTFHLANNYGAVLQAYALQSILDKKYNAEILNYDNKFISNNYKVFKSVNVNPIKTIYHFANDIINYKKESTKVKLFNEFRKNKFKLSPYFDNYNNAIIPIADVYIVGSDQVWNPFLTNGIDKVYLLNCISGSKKISYAASSGNLEYIKNNKEEFFDKLKSFDFISVREEKLKRYIIENGVEPVDVVLDPTLLLTKNMWINFLDKERIEKEKYIFVYSVNNSNKLFINFVNKFANEKKIKIVYFDKHDLNNNYKCDKKSYYSTGPKEFVNLLYYSDYVITTSFHGTALACIFNKNFYVVLSTFQDRLTTILNTLKLNNRIITNMSEYECAINDNIDWQKVNLLLDIARNKSLNWLYNSIESGKNE